MLIGEILGQDSKLAIVVNLASFVLAAMMKKVIDCRSQSQKFWPSLASELERHLALNDNRLHPIHNTTTPAIAVLSSQERLSARFWAIRSHRSISLA
jgi:hypothetical protein